MSRLGILAALAVAKESTYGTAPGSFSNYLRTVSESLSQSPTRERRAHLHHGDAGFPLSMYDGQIEAGGTTRHELTYDGLGLLFEAALGTLNASTGPSGTQYTHSAQPALSLPSYTLRSMKGQGTEEEYNGCKANRLTLSGAAGEQCFAEVEWIGKKLAGSPTRDAYGTTSPTFGDGQTPILGWHLTGFDWNGETPSPRDFSLTVDNRLDRRNLMGSQYTAEPVVQDFREVTLRVTLEWDRDTFWSGLHAGTLGTAVLTFAGSGDNAFQIDLASSQIVSVSDPVDGPGIVSQTVEIRGLAHASNPTVKLTWKNDKASATSNG